MASEDFVGAETCISCHEAQGDAWRTSDHYQSMLPATEANVLGNFDAASFSQGQRTTRFFTENGRYFIETPDVSGTNQKFRVRYTFGYRPLQQYLVETTKGRLQAFDVAWDSRPKAEGGQRWYQLQDDFVTDPEHPFFWTGYYQNWNSRCASCHSTNLQKNYSPTTHSFDTTYTDVNVACESCHGPGKEHVALARNSGMKSGSTGLYELAKAAAFHFSKDDAIARSADNSESPLALNTCGGCHSRRAELNEFDMGKPYHQQYQLDPLSEPLYFNDGQIQDEVFVLGSFLQSKMAKAGVTCTHCHDPHTTETILPGAQVCATCHKTEVFDSPEHKNGHEGADCLDCHMPERTFMGIDARRDHRFHRPSQKHPNSTYPCQTCHEDQSDSWLSEALAKWPKRKGAAPDILGSWAAVNQALAELEPAAIADAQALVLSNELPTLQQVALVDKMAGIAPDQTLPVIQQLAASSDPIGRRGAAKNALYLPAKPQTDILLSLMKDPVKSVRAEVANTIVNLPPEQFSEHKGVEALLDEYEGILKSGRDHPGPNLGLAQLARYRGEIIEAKQAFEQALKVDATHIPTLLSYAEFLRSMANTDGASEALNQALKFGEDVAAVQFAYGLHLIREKAYKQAVPHLRVAAESEDASPRFAFVYGVALWQVGQRGEAVAALHSGAKRWKGDYDILLTMAKYAYQTRQLEALRFAMAELATHYPQDGQYIQLRQAVAPFLN